MCNINVIRNNDKYAEHAKLMLVKLPNLHLRDDARASFEMFLAEGSIPGAD